MFADHCTAGKPLDGYWLSCAAEVHTKLGTKVANVAWNRDVEMMSDLLTATDGMEIGLPSCPHLTRAHAGVWVGTDDA